MAAVEGDAPYLVAGHRAAVGDGEIDAPVAHLPDVLNRRIGGSRRRRCPRIEQQIVRDAVVQVRREIAAAVQEFQIQADVGGLLLFPFQARVAQRGLAEAGLDAALRATDVVEGIARTAAELGDDAATGDVLVAGDPPAKPQHHVRDEPILREERLPRGTPPHVERGECPPLVAWSEFG